MIATLRRDAALVPLALLGALAAGALIAAAPFLSVALVAGALVLLLAFAFPVAHFTLLLIATAIVPYTVQNRVGLGGGAGSPGLIASDVLLLTGALRAVWALLVSRRLARSELVGLGLLAAYLAVTSAQFLHGTIGAGAQLSQAGDELRSVNGVAAMLVALPIVRRPGSARRLMGAMLGVGILLGLWGLAQWALRLGYAGGVGIRPGVALTATGSGQLQGGLYGFPVAVVLAFAALLSGEVRSRAARWATAAALGLNGICVVLTFERTFLLVTLLGMAVVILRTRPPQRARALLMTPLAIVAVCVPLAVASPATLTTARERLLSLGQYGNDPSVRDRVVESQHVIDQIHLHPLDGSGLGAAIWFGRPDDQVPPTINSFAHDGFLWIAWKLGVPAAGLLFGSLLLAALLPGRPRGDPLLAAVGLGAQAALLSLVVTCVTFPAVMARPITPAMGLLLAFCALPRERAGAPR